MAIGSALYEGTFDEASLTMKLERVLCGRGKLTNGMPILRPPPKIFPTIRQAAKNLSRNRTHFPQNPSRSATFFPPLT
jgi:hypothetical protein